MKLVFEILTLELIITKDSAFQIRAIKHNDAYVYKYPDNTKIVIDIDGTKCFSSESCTHDKRILLTEKICITINQCNTTIYKMDNTYCEFCRDIESPIYI